MRRKTSAGTSSERTSKGCSLSSWSLSFLHQPSFFQLTVAGTRNLLENLVDVVHVHHNSPNDVVERIEAWEASAKLKAAEASLRYLERTNSDPTLHGIFSSYVAREGDGIRADRQRFWPGSTRHPDRWTNRNLADDCRAADRLESLGLEDFYETSYRQMNWHIHGSGFAGLRGLNVETIDKIYMHSQLKSADLAIKSTTLILSEMGLLGELQTLLEKLANELGDVVRGVG